MTTTYTYRIEVTDEAGKVQVVATDPADLDRVQRPPGTFRYTDYRDKIEPLAQQAAAASQDNQSLSRQEIQTLGEALFDALFDQSLRNHFLDWYEKARQRDGSQLRMELEIDEQRSPHLAALPWEFIRLPAIPGRTGTMVLAATPHLVFSRTRSLWNAAAPIRLAPEEKLRIAVAVAAPAELRPVKYEKVWQGLQEMVTAQPERFELLPLVNPATEDSVDAVLEQKPHIFHFIGHGQMDTDEGGQIALVKEPNQAFWVYADEFGTLFTRHRPGIVVLQACEGASGSPAQAFTSVASHVVDQLIPVVVAMQYEISNIAALKFAREFYERVADGKPVDAAAQEGRIEIRNFYRTRDFATPVLYMRLRDGHLFDIKRENGAGSRAGGPVPAVSEEKGPIIPRVRQILLGCGPFDEPAAVRRIFTLSRKLQLWEDGLPGADNAAARVDALIAYLLGRFNIDKENGLVLFLEALAASKAEGDPCRQGLTRLAAELDAEVEPPAWMS